MNLHSGIWKVANKKMALHEADEFLSGFAKRQTDRAQAEDGLQFALLCFALLCSRSRCSRKLYNHQRKAWHDWYYQFFSQRKTFSLWDYPEIFELLLVAKKSKTIRTTIVAAGADEMLYLSMILIKKELSKRENESPFQDHDIREGNGSLKKLAFSVKYIRWLAEKSTSS